MNVIGFDFGTTNSMISYYNAETKELDCFQPSPTAGCYIPTIVAYKGTETIIGSLAKSNSTKKGYDTYEHFKLRLGKDAKTVIDGKSKSPIEVAGDYIRTLLDQYIKNQNIDGLDGIVMTVPETWFREASNRTARDNIEEIYRELGYDTDFGFQLESEPVAASGYFCYCYEKQNKKPFDGHVTVIDYGGGTLDITLCEIANGNIKILERCGYGEYNKSNGCAGVAFDEAVTEILCERAGVEAARGEKSFVKMRDAFEKALIENTETVCDMMIRYYKSPDIVEDEAIFTVDYNDDEVEVFCADLAECFNKVNKPYLEKSLQQIQEYFAAHKVDTSSQSKFKVLLVGGFSNFYCVENMVRGFFGSNAGLKGDKRFENCFSENNKSFAIAKGAALIAQKAVKVDHTCTHDIGYIVVRPDESDHWVDADIKIIKKGMKLSEAKEPIFAQNKVQVKVKSGSFRFFMDDGRADGKGRINAALDQTVGELFPNMDEPNNTYQIGFSVDKNLIPSVHIKDASGEMNTVSLNKLLERISICEIEDK